MVAYYLCSSRVSFVHYFALTEWSVFFFRFLRSSPRSFILSDTLAQVGLSHDAKNALSNSLGIHHSTTRDSNTQFGYYWMHFKPFSLSTFFSLPCFLFSSLQTARARASTPHIARLRTANRVNAYGDQACPYYQATTGV